MEKFTNISWVLDRLYSLPGLHQGWWMASKLSISKIWSI
jgi:hypothetical protein